MQVSGIIKGISRNWVTNKAQITLEINEQLADEVNDLADCEKLSIEIKKWRKKRSLDANAYAWKLISLLAETLKMSKDQCYELMLQRYGSTLTDDNGAVIVSLLSNIDSSTLPMHCAFVGNGYAGGKEFSHYRLIKGSSEYDSKEMSVFIDGVVSECKELGIETLPPQELERMAKEWNQ